MQLSDYFAHLNGINLAQFLLCFFTFDAIGLRIGKYIKTPDYLRLVNWIFGLALFVLLWFFLHAVVPFTPVFTWLSLLIFSLVFLPGYFIHRGYTSLGQAIKDFPYPFAIILLIIKPIYFFLSAPPYMWDEMAYHYYSPAKLVTEKYWQFLDGPSLYESLPRFLDTSFILLFSLTKTYATARLLHFMIVFSAIFTIGWFLKKRAHSLVGILYVLLALLQSAEFIQSSTLGYVDAAPAIFTPLLIIVLADYMVTQKKNLFYSAAILFGITISMKYTIVIFPSIALCTALISLLLINRNRILEASKKINLRIIRRSFKIGLMWLLLMGIFGGYWYFKNLILTGNPIYPFLFKCFKGMECGRGNQFFAGWTIPFDKLHFITIRAILFQKDAVLFYASCISLAIAATFSIFLRVKWVLYATLLILLSVLIEIAVARKFTGFEFRYYFHWLQLIPLVIILPLALTQNLAKKIVSKNAVFVILGVSFVLLSTGSVLKKNFHRFYEGDYVPGYVRNYAMNRIGLNEWIDYFFPHTGEFIKYCGRKMPMQKIISVDPNLVWFSYEGMMRVYMVNCNLSGANFSLNKKVEELNLLNKKEFSGLYFIADERCITDKKKLKIYDDRNIQQRYDLNQSLVCSLKEVFKNVYQL